jgi:hypothetical protein
LLLDPFPLVVLRFGFHELMSFAHRQ